MAIKVSVMRRKGERIWQMQYTDPDTGQKIRRSTRQRSESKARKAAGKWEAEVNEGRDVRTSGRMPWPEFRELYETQQVSGLAEKTAIKISGVFNVLERIINPRRLCDVNEQALARYAEQLRALQRSESTIKGHLAHILAALNWARQCKCFEELHPWH